MISVPRHPKRNQNQDSQPCGDGQYPCVVCGKPIKMGKVGLVVRLWYGSDLVTEAEAVQLLATEEASGDTGYYPIGENCARKYLSAEERRLYVSNATVTAA